MNKDTQALTLTVTCRAEQVKNQPEHSLRSQHGGEGQRLLGTNGKALDCTLGGGEGESFLK